MGVISELLRLSTTKSARYPSKISPQSVSSLVIMPLLLSPYTERRWQAGHRILCYSLGKQCRGTHLLNHIKIVVAGGGIVPKATLRPSFFILSTPGNTACKLQVALRTMGYINAAFGEHLHIDIAQPDNGPP